MPPMGIPKMRPIHSGAVTVIIAVAPYRLGIVSRAANEWSTGPSGADIFIVLVGVGTGPPAIPPSGSGRRKVYRLSGNVH